MLLAEKTAIGMSRVDTNPTSHCPFVYFGKLWLCLQHELKTCVGLIIFFRCVEESLIDLSLREHRARYAIPSLTLPMRRHSPLCMVHGGVFPYHQRDTRVLMEGKKVSIFFI
jgi:hypothetical protein